VVTAYLTRQVKPGEERYGPKHKNLVDAEGDYLEVRFSDAPGSMKATSNDAEMKRVDASGNIIGFSILGVSRFQRETPLTAELVR
jgi:hypothetical protein